MRCAHELRSPVVRWSAIAALAVLLPAAACDVQYVRIGYDEDPLEELAGEWQGTWTSTADDGSGPLTVRVRQFRGEPLVELLLANPCLVPGDYDLSLRDGRIELGRAGDVVLRAAALADGSLGGSYDCGADRGVLTATWSRALPMPLDLAGPWQGELLRAGAPAEPLQVEFSQAAVGGGLELAAQVTAPGIDFAVDLAGLVEFGDADFQFLLRSPAAVSPELVLVGRGSREPLRIDLATLQWLDGGASAATALVRLEPLPD